MLETLYRMHTNKIYLVVREYKEPSASGYQAAGGQFNLQPGDVVYFNIRNQNQGGPSCAAGMNCNILFDLLDRRKQTSAMILTSNRVVGEWAQVFPEPVLANAALDRMFEYAIVHIFEGKSYRLGGKIEQLN